MAETYEWIPLTEAEIDEMTGVAMVKAMVAAGDPIAALLLRRIEAAQQAMEPEVARLKEQWEREIMQGSGTGGGLSLLVGEG